MGKLLGKPSFFWGCFVSNHSINPPPLQLIAKVSENLGEAMVGINCDEMTKNPKVQLSQTPE